MTRHAFDELTFALPDAFAFVGMVRLRGEKNDTFGPNLVLTKDRMREGETFQTYVDRQIVDLARKLKKFGLRGRREVSVGGLPAQELTCAWQGTQGQIEQRVTVLHRDADVLTFTASAGKAHADEAFTEFRGILDSIRFDAGPLSTHELG